MSWPGCSDVERYFCLSYLTPDVESDPTSHQPYWVEHCMRALQPALKYWVVKPALPVRRVVRCYFAVDSEANGYDSEELLLPDGWSEIVFAFAANFDRRLVAAPEQRTVMSRSYIIGGRSHSVVTGGSDRVGSLHCEAICESSMPSWVPTTR